MVKDGDNNVYDTLEKLGCVWEEVALGLSWEKNAEGIFTLPVYVPPCSLESNEWNVQEHKTNDNEK